MTPGRGRRDTLVEVFLTVPTRAQAAWLFVTFWLGNHSKRGQETAALPVTDTFLLSRDFWHQKRKKKRHGQWSFEADAEWKCVSSGGLSETHEAVCTGPPNTPPPPSRQPPPPVWLRAVFHFRSSWSRSNAIPFLNKWKSIRGYKLLVRWRALNKHQPAWAGLAVMNKLIQEMC